MNPVISTQPLMTLASGDTLQLQLYRFVGATAGKVVYLQSNLHGAELTGNAVIQQLMAYLQTLDEEALQGEIRLLPGCNPVGVNTRMHHFPVGRFNPYDGRDWNRIFWDHEQAYLRADSFAQEYLEADLSTVQEAYREEILTHFRAELEIMTSAVGIPFYQRYSLCLQQHALDADIVIDLHTSSSQGMVYLYYFRDRTPFIRYFGVDFALLLDEYDGNAFDESFINPWLALESAFAKLGRSLQFDIDAWTLELGNGMQIDPAAAQRGVSGVLNYLRGRDILADQPAVAHKAVPLSQRSQVLKYYARTGGFVQYLVTLGTWVNEGDALFEILSLSKTGTPPRTQFVYAQEAGLVYDFAWNQAVNEGEYVLAMMIPIHNDA